MARQPGHRGEFEVLSRARIEVLSDGIFAIVLTLLALELRPPTLGNPNSVSELAVALVALSPKVLSWIISFAAVCVVWVNHHRLFSLLRETDHTLFWLNANLLLWVTLLTFPTALIGDYPGNPLALTTYGAVGILMGMAFVVLRLHMLRGDHLEPDVDVEQFRRLTRQTFIMSPVAYAIGIGLAWVWTPLAFLMYAAVSAYFILPFTVRARFPI